MRILLLNEDACPFFNPFKKAFTKVFPTPLIIKKMRKIKILIWVQHLSMASQCTLDVEVFLSIIQLATFS
jgi:hypothetical protein